MHLGNVLRSLITQAKKLARLLGRVKVRPAQSAQVPEYEHRAEAPAESVLGLPVSEEPARLDDIEEGRVGFDVGVSTPLESSAESRLTDRVLAGDAPLLDTLPEPFLSSEEIEVGDEFAVEPEPRPLAAEIEVLEVEDIPPHVELGEITLADDEIPYEGTPFDLSLAPADAEGDQQSEVAEAIKEDEQIFDSLPEQVDTTALPKLVVPSSPRLAAPRRPRPAPTPKFDFSQHPEVSGQELDEFLRKADLGDLGTMAGLTARRLDALLMLALKDVGLIGELPISAAAFAQITALMRRTFVVNNRLSVSRIWPALLVTSMVFCARYSEEETRSFWTPYARLVWGLHEASQSFQNLCRAHFERCRLYLEKEYKFIFPIIPDRERSVVRPVFYHAVIPFYLQDDFARWLAANADKLHIYSADALPNILRDDPSLSRMPPSLRRFIQEEDTAETAAELVVHLAEAAKLYREGEDVAALMVNPIQRALWTELQKALEEKVEREHIRRAPQPRLAWIWSLEEAELQLRLTYLSVDPTRHAPDLCVWTDKAEVNLSKSETALVLYPFKSHDKGWLVDEVLLVAGPLDGQVSVLSVEHDDESPDILYQADVPPLPDQAILFFRERRRDLGVLLGDNARITDGEWLVSMAEGVELRDADGQTLAPIEPRYVPDVLREHCAHAKAGRYELRLPVTVLHDGQEVLYLERNPDEIGQPQLVGPYQEASLSPRIPPVFTALPITLHIPFMESERLRRVTLTVKSNEPHSVHTLDELQARRSLTRTSDGGCTIALDGLFPQEPGLYSASLRRDLKALSDEPIQFIFLPGITLKPPDLSQHYSPTNLPQAHIEGVPIEYIVVDHNRAVCESVRDGVLITWRDLKDPECSLRLEIGGRSIPLAWPIKRTYAWVEGVAADSTLRPRYRKEAVIHIRGEPSQQVIWHITDNNQQRDFKLNARGQWDCQLSQDPLIDMIERCSHTRVVVNIKAWNSEWTLFEYVRRPCIQVERVTYDADQKLLMLESQVGHVREGDFRLQLLDPHALMEDPLIIADFQRLEPSLAFECELIPRDYCVQLLSSGVPLDIEPAVVSFSVTDQFEPIQVGPSVDDPLSILVKPGSTFQQLASDEVGGVSALVQRLAAINRPNEWVQHYGLLPAWAVLSHPLTLTTREHRVALWAYPEVASHRGQAGKGYLDLSLEGDTPTRVYATWEPLTVAESILYSRLRIMIPTHEVSGPFSTLDELDLWPAYQCSLCGRIVGSRSGTYLKLSPSTLNAHGHRKRYRDKRERFRDIVYGYELHVSVMPMKHTPLPYVFSPLQKIDTQYLLGKLKTSIEILLPTPDHPISVDAYRHAVAQWLGNYLTGYREPLERLVGDRKWREGFDRLEKSRHDTGTEPMLAATNRLLDVITEARSSENQMIWLDRNMILLALLLRSLASSPRTHEELRLRAGFTDGDLRTMLALALQVCPLLLEWAITWVELFRVHAIS